MGGCNVVIICPLTVAGWSRCTPLSITLTCNGSAPSVTGLTVVSDLTIETERLSYSN